MINNTKTPSFICIGSQRAGTTWLHECLKEHPDVFLPREKEVHYFDRFYNKGFKWYLNKFSDGQDKLCGEITPNYYQAEGALDRIKQNIPNVKIIYILREPVSRARSQFQLFSDSRYKGKTFKDVLDADPVVSDLSFQGKHLQKLHKLFSKKQVLVLFYDELASEPESLLNKVFNFLSIDGDFKPSHLNKRMNRVVLPELQNKLRKLGLSWFIDLAKKSPLSEFIKERFHNTKKGNSTCRKTISSELIAKFHHDIEIIENELDVDLSHWKKN